MRALGYGTGLGTAALLLAACSPEPGTAGGVEGSVRNADSAQIAQPLDLELPLPPLGGELRCSWADRAGTWMVAAADADAASRPVAVMAVAGLHVRLDGTTAGGFAEMERGGGRFAGPSLVATVETGRRDETGHEGTRREATLTVARDGDSRRMRGWWECGP